MKIDHFPIMDVVTEPCTPLQNLVHEIEYFCDELYEIGDAKIPRNLYNAVHEGDKVEVQI